MDSNPGSEFGFLLQKALLEQIQADDFSRQVRSSMYQQRVDWSRGSTPDDIRTGYERRLDDDEREWQMATPEPELDSEYDSPPSSSPSKRKRTTDYNSSFSSKRCRTKQDSRWQLRKILVEGNPNLRPGLPPPILRSRSDNTDRRYSKPMTVGNLRPSTIRSTHTMQTRSKSRTRPRKTSARSRSRE